VGGRQASIKFLFRKLNLSLVRAMLGLRPNHAAASVRRKAWLKVKTPASQAMLRLEDGI
jgi:hypothetical protein